MKWGKLPNRWQWYQLSNKKSKAFVTGCMRISQLAAFQILLVAPDFDFGDVVMLGKQRAWKIKFLYVQPAYILL